MTAASGGVFHVEHAVFSLPGYWKSESPWIASARLSR